MWWAAALAAALASSGAASATPAYDRLGRVLVPTVTPLASDGSFDASSFGRLVAYLAAAGADGLYVAGSTGEGLHLPLHTRRELAATAVREARSRGLTVMVHVGAPRSADAVALGRHAKEVGADAVSALPPFVGGAAFEDVLRFYADLAAASAPVPVLAYYIPAVTKSELSLDQLSQISSLPNVMGFKFTGYDLFKMSRLLARMDPGQVVYNGQDQMVALGLQYGAHGGIGSAYNFLMPRYRAVVDRFVDGNYQGSVAEQLEINEVLELYKQGAGARKQVATIKQILVWHGVLETAECAQRASLTEDEQRALRAALGAHQATKPLLTAWSAAQSPAAKAEL